MNTQEIINQLAKRSSINARSPKDMIHYSHLGYLHDYPNYKSTHDWPREPGYYQFFNQAERERAIVGYSDYYFEYYLNDIGFRGNYPATTDSGIIGFFGCSFTFGEGLPEEKNFPSIISNHFNKKCLNLGLGGASAYHTSLIFSAAANIWNMETAVILFPWWGRFSYVDKHNQLLSILPTLKYNVPEVEQVRKDIITDFSDQYSFAMTKDAIMNILTVAKLKNIKVLFTSWDGEVNWLIKTLFGDAPQFNYDPTNVARDPYHPGEHSVNNYAKNVIDFISQNKFHTSRLT